MTAHNYATALVKTCLARGLTLTVAESCTGGLLAAAITSVPGSSAVFGTGFVTYANAAKTALLGVPAALIETDGAVSEAVARSMAEGAKGRAEADLAAAITGIAGPGGGSPEKPVGTVWFGCAGPAGTGAQRREFTGGRDAVRAASVVQALRLLLEAADA